MSPTSLVPGASAWKLRASKSGVALRSPATVVVGRKGRGWHRVQTRRRTFARTMKGGVNTAVPIGVIGVVEDPFDEGGQPGPASAGGRGGPVAPLVEA